jgi:Xaa-Pro aminopeptidase
LQSGGSVLCPGTERYISMILSHRYYINVHNFACYLKIDKVLLFIDNNKINTVVEQYFDQHKVVLCSYDHIIKFLHTLQLSMDKSDKIWVDPRTVNVAIGNAIAPQVMLQKTSPVVLLKAKKNSAEINGMKQAHIRDAVAFVEFISELEEKLHKGINVREFDIDVDLTAHRQRYGNGMFVGPSFDTIAGVNGNGAIIHYK